MNRTLLVSLLKKNIDELILLTEGFAEMSEYPAAIIILAKNKTDDIKSYIDQLGDIYQDTIADDENISEEVPIIVEDKAPEYTKDNVVTLPETLSEVKDAATIKVSEYAQEVVINEEIDQDYTEEEEEEEESIDEPPTVENVIIEKKITLAEKLASQTTTRNELHAKTEANAVNDSIAHKKIEDIRQAISLGDRFRFQRELFKNNGEEMNKMLNYINLLASYDEIESFLQSKYGWPEDLSAANDFYQIIKRKF